MSVEQVNEIDFVAHKGDLIVLTISDHLDWDDDEHLFTRQEKLNTYIRYVESGEIFETLELPTNTRIRVDMLCKFKPSNLGERFLEKVSESMGGLNLELKIKILASED